MPVAISSCLSNTSVSSLCPTRQKIFEYFPHIVFLLHLALLNIWQQFFQGLFLLSDTSDAFESSNFSCPGAFRNGLQNTTSSTPSGKELEDVANPITTKVCQGSGSGAFGDVAGTAGKSPKDSSGDSVEESPSTESAWDDVEAPACGGHLHKSPTTIFAMQSIVHLTPEENMKALHQAEGFDFLWEAGANKAAIVEEPLEVVKARRGWNMIQMKTPHRQSACQHFASPYLLLSQPARLLRERLPDAQSINRRAIDETARRNAPIRNAKRHQPSRPPRRATAAKVRRVNKV